MASCKCLHRSSVAIFGSSLQLVDFRLVQKSRMVVAVHPKGVIVKFTSKSLVIENATSYDAFMDDEMPSRHTTMFTIGGTMINAKKRDLQYGDYVFFQHKGRIKHRAKLTGITYSAGKAKIEINNLERCPTECVGRLNQGYDNLDNMRALHYWQATDMSARIVAHPKGVIVKLTSNALLDENTTCYDAFMDKEVPRRNPMVFRIGRSRINVQKRDLQYGDYIFFQYHGWIKHRAKYTGVTYRSGRAKIEIHNLERCPTECVGQHNQGYDDLDRTRALRYWRRTNARK